MDLESANGFGTSGSATRSKASCGVKVVLNVLGLPDRGTMYLARIHPGTCGEEKGRDQGDSGHEHEASAEIEYPLSPVESNKQGEGSSTTVVHKVTLS